MPGIQNSKGVLSFLDSVGDNDRGDRVQLNHTAEALVELADFLITTARGNMDKKGHTATGKTAASMKAGPLQTNATKMQIDITIDSTYKFLNEGVKGVEGGTGKYAFKTKYPSKKMVQAIKAWARVRGAGGRIKYKAVSKNEAKNQRLNKAIKGKGDGIYWGMATNIKKKGIKPTYFFSGKSYSAIEATKRERKKRFSQALKLDIIEMFN